MKSLLCGPGSASPCLSHPPVLCHAVALPGAFDRFRTVRKQLRHLVHAAGSNAATSPPAEQTGPPRVLPSPAPANASADPGLPEARAAGSVKAPARAKLAAPSAAGPVKPPPPVRPAAPSAAGPVKAPAPARPAAPSASRAPAGPANILVSGKAKQPRRHAASPLVIPDRPLTISRVDAGASGLGISSPQAAPRRTSVAARGPPSTAAAVDTSDLEAAFRLGEDSLPPAAVPGQLPEWARLTPPPLPPPPPPRLGWVGAAPSVVASKTKRIASVAPLPAAPSFDSAPALPTFALAPAPAAVAALRKTPAPRSAAAASTSSTSIRVGSAVLERKVDPLGGELWVGEDTITKKRVVMTKAQVAAHSAGGTVAGAGRTAAAASKGSAAGSSAAATAAAAAVRASSLGVAPTRRLMPSVEREGDDLVLIDFENDLDDIKQLAPVYQQRLIAAINAEKLHEADMLRNLYSSSSLRRLQKEGVVLTDLRMQRHSELFNSTVYRLHLGGKELSYHRFRKGDSVLLDASIAGAAASAGSSRGASSKDSGGGAASSLAARKASAAAAAAAAAAAVGGMDDDDDPTLEATVLDVMKDGVLVAVDGKTAEALNTPDSCSAGMRWRMDQSVKDTTTMRQRQALDSLHSVGKGSLWRNEDAASEKVLRCILLGSRNSVAIAAQSPLWVKEKAWRDRAKAALEDMHSLNSSQRSAVAQAITRTLTLWQGPPGTGKTRTLLALIDVLVQASGATKGSWKCMRAVLACADTNAAVDNLVDGLQERDIRVVRVGVPAKVREDIRHLTLEALAGSTEDGKRSLELRHYASTAEEEFYKGIPRGRFATLTALQKGQLAEVQSRAGLDLKEANFLHREACEQVLSRAQVVCSTCTGAGDRSIAERNFRMVVIDEATQATEPATLIPLMRGAQCVVMAGDPQQLPPTIVSQDAFNYALDVTMFERIALDGVEALLLNRQYRMHPSISAFPSAHFYAGRLMDAVTAGERTPPRGIRWPAAGCPVAIVAVENGQEQRADSGSAKLAASASSSSGRGGGTTAEGAAAGGGGGGSYRNMEEATVALQIVGALLAAGDVSSIALLTPYRGQVRALEALLRTPEVAGPLGALAAAITVSSVDGYQGREADVVVFTTVRINAQGGSIGFVKDPRRLNVAITRPRRGLVVVCSPRSLANGSKDWRAYLRWAKEQGCITTASRVLGGGLLREDSLRAGASAVLPLLLSADEED